MADREDGPDEDPATWENVVVGKAKQVIGRAIGDDELEEEGEDQEEVAHEVAAEAERDEQA
jgi:uncharacterized protein YjbJ (UPF0337 family)